MKKCFFLLASLLFYGMASAQNPAASIVFNNPPTSSGIILNANGGDSQTRYVSKDGQTCLEAVDYAYFKVDKSAVATSDNNLIFEITYFDEETGSFTLQYNAYYDGNNSSNYKGTSFNQTGTGKWITATVAISDANFRNAQNGDADFRIAKGVFIREMKIFKGTLNPESETVPDYTNVPTRTWSEFTGKSVAGYQMWFSTGDATSGWFHWNGTTAPSPGKLSFEIYPDVSEYEDAALAQTGFANLGNGEPSKLFSSSNSQVIETHFKWMSDAHLDGVAIQRFIGGLGKAIINSEDALLMKAKRAAEDNERLFYICYDISSTGLEGEWADRIKFDWVYNIEKTFELTQSPAYAKVGKKPVVQIWGTGFTGNHPGTEQETIDLINFLKSRGCYVIGGVPTHWRNQTGDSKPNFINAYNAYDMLSPWMVGRFSDTSGADNFKNQMAQDAIYCRDKGIKYMPVLMPGFAWSQWNEGPPNHSPRNAGEFMWHQAKNIMDLYQYGVENMYFAMFDEYDEATALMKAATDWSMIPTDQYFLTTSADGYWLSSDYQLRVTGAAIDMQKSGTKLNEIPVPHSEGPVYYRNSFESRTTPYDYKNGVARQTGTFPLDPCFKNPKQISASGVSGQATAMRLASELGVSAKSGLYVARINGNATAATGAYLYKFADAKIEVKENMELSFSKYTVNNPGKYTTVSLVFSDESYLHNFRLSDKDGIDILEAKGTVGQWTDHTFVIGQGQWVGKTITGILLTYEGNATGTFDAYFDNLLIQDGDGSSGIMLPDLIVTDISWQPTVPKDGGQVLFSATIKNQGTDFTPDESTITVEFSIGNDLITGDYAFFLSPQGEAVVYANSIWTCGTESSYTIKAHVNRSGAIEESIYTNNERTAQMDVSVSLRQPDLVVEDFTWTPANPVNGDQVVFGVTIKNQGDAATPGGVKHGVVFLINDMPVSWTDTHFDSMEPGESVTLTVNGGPNNVNYWVCGNEMLYPVTAFVNDQNDIKTESNTDNNKLTKNVQANQPIVGTDHIAENKGIVYIESKKIYADGYPASASLYVYNLSGQLIAYTLISDMNIALPQGVYIVKIQYDEKTEVHKLLIK